MPVPALLLLLLPLAASETPAAAESSTGVPLPLPFDRDLSTRELETTCPRLGLVPLPSRSTDGSMGCRLSVVAPGEEPVEGFRATSLTMKDGRVTSLGARLSTPPAPGMLDELLVRFGPEGLIPCVATEELRCQGAHRELGEAGLGADCRFERFRWRALAGEVLVEFTAEARVCVGDFRELDLQWRVR